MFFLNLVLTSISRECRKQNAHRADRKGRQQGQNRKAYLICAEKERSKEERINFTVELQERLARRLREPKYSFRRSQVSQDRADGGSRTAVAAASGPCIARSHGNVVVLFVLHNREPVQP